MPPSYAGDNTRNRDEKRGGRFRRTTIGKATRRCAGRPPGRSFTRCTCADSRGIRAPGCHAKTRGTYAGLIEKIPYLQQLGITAVELLPVFQFDAQDCPAGTGQLLGLLAGFVLCAASGLQFAAGPARPVNEFRDMVKALHRAGIEVILDVVFNHTAEGDHRGQR